MRPERRAAPRAPVVRRVLMAAASLAVVAYASASYVLWRDQTRLVFPAPRAALGAPDAAARGAGYRREILPVAPGEGLAFWAAPPAPGRAAVLFFHGNASAASSGVRTLQPLRAAGYGVVLAEYPGYSGNAGRPSERRFDRDARLYLAWTEAHFPGAGLPAVIGESIGTGVAVRLAAERRVRGVVLDSPFSSLAAVVRHGPFWWAPTVLLTSPFDSVATIRRVSAPVLILHGEDDQLIPGDQARRLAAATPCLWGALSEPGVGHLVLATDPADGAARTVLAFLASLRPDGACVPPQRAAAASR